MKAGSLVAVEGLDGSGKSTQAQTLAQALREAGLDVLLTREPTDGPVGRRIREHARVGERVDPGEELRWFLEDRRAHVAGEIQPALSAGRVVVTDRYFLSTVAYQGARGLDWERLLEQSEAEFPLPTVAVVLDVDPGLGLARVASRGRAVEPAFEEPAYLARVAAIFACIERPYVAHVDGSATPDSVADSVHAAVWCRLRLA